MIRFALIFLMALAGPALAEDPDMSIFLKKTDIFDGDVRGPWNKLILKVPLSTSTITSGGGTNGFPSDGANIVNINAANITQGILPWARLDIMSGGDLSGSLPAPEVIDNSHNHGPQTLNGVETSTAAAIAYAAIGIATAALSTKINNITYSKIMYSGTLGQGSTFYSFVPDTNITLTNISTTIHYVGTSGTTAFYCGNTSGLSVSVSNTDSIGDLKSSTGSVIISSGTQIYCYISSTTQTLTPVVNLELLYTKG